MAWPAARPGADPGRPLPAVEAGRGGDRVPSPDARLGPRTVRLPRKPYATLKLSGQTSPAAGSGAVGTGPLYLNENEAVDLNVFGPAARDIRDDAMKADLVAAILALIPDMGIDLHFWGMGGHANIFCGSVQLGVEASSMIVQSAARRSDLIDSPTSAASSRTCSIVRSFPP